MVRLCLLDVLYVTLLCILLPRILNVYQAVGLTLHQVIILVIEVILPLILCIFSLLVFIVVHRNFIKSS